MISPTDTLKKVAYEGLGRVLGFVNDPKAAARRTVDDAKRLPMTVATTTLVAVYKLRTRNQQPTVTTPPSPSAPLSDTTPAAPVRTAAAQREAELEAVALAQPVPEVTFQKKPAAPGAAKVPAKAAAKTPAAAPVKASAKTATKPVPKAPARPAKAAKPGR